MSNIDEKKEVIKKVTNWIKEEGHSTIEKTDKDPYADLNVVIQYSRYSVNVIILKDKKDKVSVVSRQVFSDQDKKAFSSLKMEKKQPFFEDLEFSLLPMNVSYSIYPDRNSMEYIEIVKPIYFDGLTKDRFYDSIFAVVRALHLTSLLYNKHLYPGSSTSSSFAAFIL